MPATSRLFKISRPDHFSNGIKHADFGPGFDRLKYWENIAAN
jgi:hypothetical protein